MSTTRCLLAALGWALAGAVSAQSAGPSPTQPGTDASSLERAQRLAANPMRMILEASRVERRPAADGAPAGEAGWTPRSVAARMGAAANGATGASGASGANALARPEVPPEPGITVVLQLPADLPRDISAEPRLPSLDRPPAAAAPIALDALDGLPWPDDLGAASGTRGGADEPRSAQRVAWWQSLLR